MIGKAIYNILKNNSAVHNLIGDKIFPYAIEENTQLPVAVYRVPVITPEYTKDGVVEEENKVEILALSNSYANCLDIGAAIRSALEYKKGTVENINIVQSRVDSIEETYDFEGNVYMNKFNFSIITK